MAKRALRRPIVPVVLAGLFACGGCNDDTNDTNPASSTPPPTAGLPPGPGPGGPGGGRERSPIGSLTQRIGQELEQADPPWSAIQGETQRYATLVSELSEYSPPKGSEESWESRTAEFLKSATALDEAAKARDKDAALTAHEAISGSCMDCHREHRVMGRGRGGPGGPGFGPGGPPGGGPGGPPGGGAPPQDSTGDGQGPPR
jgi:hypothetical protein